MDVWKRMERKLFDRDVFVYAYVDRTNVERRQTRYIQEYPDEYGERRDCGKTWLPVRFGYFVLISNLGKTWENLLDDYFLRTGTESVFKTGKIFLGMPSLLKWSAENVRGKLLLDVVDMAALLLFWKEIGPSGIFVSEFIGKRRRPSCASPTPAGI